MAPYIHVFWAMLGILGIGDSVFGASNSVSGKVIDSNGRPVAGAEVLLLLHPMGGVTPVVISDKAGRFKFENINTKIIPSGWKPELSARKPADYLMIPEAFILGFPTGGKIAHFHLSESHDVMNQVIQFGPSGGRLVLRFKDEKDKRLTGKIKVARKGEKPPLPRYNYMPLDVVMPTGLYEITVFTMEEEYIDKIEVKVEQRKDTEILVPLPEKFRRK